MDAAIAGCFSMRAGENDRMAAASPGYLSKKGCQPGIFVQKIRVDANEGDGLYCKDRKQEVNPMLHSLKLGRSLIAAAAIFWGIASVTSANANTILVTPDLSTEPPNIGQPNPVLVSGDIVGLVIGDGAGFLAGTSSTTAATGFAFNGGVAEELAFFNAQTGATQTDLIKFDGFNNVPGNTGTSENGTFDIAAEFFGIKSDGWIAFFHNLSGGLTTITYCAVVSCSDGALTENGAGISHVSAYVPIPAVGAGLPGLVLACGGLLALARRRRQQIA